MWHFMRSSRAGVLQLHSAILIVVTAILIGVVSMGGFKAFTVGRTAVHDSERFRLNLRDVSITPLPVWIRADLLAQVQRAAGLPDELSSLDVQLTTRLGEAFGTNPWVRRVREVRLIHPRTVRVSLTYREPVAVVQTAQSLHPIDCDGVLLPADDLADPAIYVAISGVGSTPTGPAGAKWQDPVVLAAALTADALAGYHLKLGIAAIDVSEYRPAATRPGHIALLTEAGTRVKWGRPPDDDFPGEVSTQDKLARLFKYLQDHGSLDKPAGPNDIDITHLEEITVRPRAAGDRPRRQPAPAPLTPAERRQG
jgi:cell division septal protein FtsQ